jgi:hypothetical protein
MNFSDATRNVQLNGITTKVPLAAGNHSVFVTFELNQRITIKKLQIKGKRL